MLFLLATAELQAGSEHIRIRQAGKEKSSERDGVLSLPGVSSRFEMVFSTGSRLHQAAESRIRQQDEKRQISFQEFRHGSAPASCPKQACLLHHTRQQKFPHLLSAPC